jgi:hypothetical protein
LIGLRCTGVGQSASVHGFLGCTPSFRGAKFSTRKNVQFILHVDLNISYCELSDLSL